MAEFQWWLLLLGLVAGGGIVAVVYMDGTRREQDIADDELLAEATWISERLAVGGRAMDPGTVERVLLEHQAYRLEPPPDRLESVAEPLVVAPIETTAFSHAVPASPAPPAAGVPSEAPPDTTA